LPIGYYPALSDESLDRILLDQSQYTVEWMITPQEHAKALDLQSLIAGNNFVRVVRSDAIVAHRHYGSADSVASQVHRVDITDSNVHSWTSESPLTQALGLELEGGRPGGARPGDVVWLAQRKKIPEVSAARKELWAIAEHR
jgi:aspartyl-tRNA synthetase